MTEKMGGGEIGSWFCQTAYPLRARGTEETGGRGTTLSFEARSWARYGPVALRPPTHTGKRTHSLDDGQGWTLRMRSEFLGKAGRTGLA
jgi:hypothetical protein